MPSRNPNRPHQPPHEARVHTDAMAQARLMQLGFERPQDVREALQDGRAAARSAMTPYHPASYAGMRMWGETTASLAHLAGDYGWEHETFYGVDLVAHHAHGVAVIVTSGDGATGDEKYQPQVRYERREVITRLVNAESPTLWDVQRQTLAWDVWFLLHCIERDGVGVPAELSRPAEVNNDGFVTRFAERVLIPSFDPGDPGRGTEGTGDATPNTPVVNIQRRAG